MSLLFTFFCCSCLFGQSKVRGIVLDAGNNDVVIGASVIIQSTTTGTLTDWDGSFEFDADMPYPFSVEVSYLGYETKVVEILSDALINISLAETTMVIEGVEVKASRISDKQKKSPLTIESLDLIAIKETPAADFYDGLGALKGVDLTAASLGFKVINMRGFNSTSPVRSLQIIDGIDNQAPGLNFSLGNFLGSSELDVNKVELIVGASSAFYGPNAFNGVISMETKDPFFHTGLSAFVKVAERNMFKGAVRWADAFENSDGHQTVAYKLNFEALRADDWVANNYSPVDDSDVDANNLGGFDAVNIYGDEYQNGNDFSDFPITDPGVGTLGTWFRTGYREEDLVDYNTRNYKANAAVHFKLMPSKAEQSPEVIIASSFGSGTTVYQGDNRFSLKGITFLQNKIELRKRNKFFLRAYTTRTGAGDSYDPYFTALQLQENAKENREWSIDYADFWQNGSDDATSIKSRIQEMGYPELEVSVDPMTGMITTSFDTEAAEQFFIDNADLFREWHAEAAAYANGPAYGASSAVEFFAPGTARFDEEFNRITGSLRSDGGTRFYDNSALYHVHGEYNFTPTWMDKITLGSNYRLYTPDSRGTVFYDTADIKITNYEYGMYAGIEKSFVDNKLKLSVTTRFDKNQNFDLQNSNAMSLVYTPSENNFFRLSYSSALRNPTLSDQYLFLDVGRATLAGHIGEVRDLVTIESLRDYFANPGPGVLDSFNIAALRPEEVQTFEFGFRTTLFEKLYVDAGTYYSIYNNFLGFNIGADVQFDGTGIGISKLDIFRYSANSTNEVRTRGASLGLNYYLASNYSISGNYSWNKLIKTADDDPIIPAFNTPEHKFNVGFGGRNLSFNLGGTTIKHFGFNINYKWIEGFLFEGSPQFTGFIPTYDMVDAQINFYIPGIYSTLKIGASNLLDNRAYQTYGGPEIGRLAYISLTYEPK